jgi:hypothetical protein
MWIAYENGVIIATIAATTLDGIYRKLKDRAQVAERAAIAQAEQAQAAPAQRKEALLEGAGHEYVLDQDRVEQLRNFAVEYHGSLTDGQVWHHRLLNDDGEPMYYYTQSQIDTMLDKLWAEASRQDEPVETAALTETQVEQSAPSAPAQRKEVPPDAREIDDLTMRFERLGWRFRLFVDRTTAQRSFLVEPDTTVGWTQMQKLTSIEDAWELLGKLEREAQEQPAGEPQPAPAKWKPTPDQMQRIKRMNAQYGVEISYDPYQLWHARRGKMIIGNYCFAPDLDELESKLQSKTASTDPLAPVNDPAQGLVAEIRYWRDTSKRHEQERDEVQKHNWSLFQQNRRLMEQKLELIRKLKRLERGQR